jgi:hypothetical protein
MNYPYSSFFLYIELAKRQLAQVLAEGPGAGRGDTSPDRQESFPVRFSLLRATTERGNEAAPYIDFNEPARCPCWR